MPQLPLEQAIPRFKANEERVDNFTNGSDTTNWLTSTGVVVPSLRKFLRDKSAEIQAVIDNAETEVTTITNNANAAIDTAVADADAAVSQFVATGTAEIDAAVATADNVANFSVADLSTLLARTSALPTDTIVQARAEKFSYRVVASNGDKTTAGGTHLNLLPSSDGSYPILGLAPAANGVTNDRTLLNRLNLSGRTVDLGGRDLAYIGAAWVPVATFKNGRILAAGSTYDYRSLPRRELLTYRYLSGMEPEKLSGTVLRLQPGSCVDNTGTTYVQSLAPIDITLTTNGPGGLDAGAISSGIDYFPYIIRNNSTGAVSAVASASQTYGGVTVPSGWTMIRKLPWGFVYRTSVGWGVESGIPDFHLTAWPKPLTTFSAFELASPFVVLSSGNASAWANIDLAPWIPDNARLVRLMTRTFYSTSTGTAYLRTLGVQGTGIPVGMAGSAGVSAYNTLDIRTTSTRTISYRVIGGVELTVGVMGYSQTEPS